jgi:hypothetical protein
MEMDGSSATAAISTGAYTVQLESFLSAVLQYFCNIVHPGFTTEIHGEFQVVLATHMRASSKAHSVKPLKR